MIKVELTRDLVCVLNANGSDPNVRAATPWLPGDKVRLASRVIPILLE